MIAIFRGHAGVREYEIVGCRQLGRAQPANPRRTGASACASGRFNAAERKIDGYMAVQPKPFHVFPPLPGLRAGRRRKKAIREGRVVVVSRLAFQSDSPPRPASGCPGSEGPFINQHLFPLACASGLYSITTERDDIARAYPHPLSEGDPHPSPLPEGEGIVPPQNSFFPVFFPPRDAANRSEHRSP